MKLLKFGSYDEYKRIQVEANRLKFANVFAEEEELRRIAQSFAASGSTGRKGLCHGVRNGYEVQLLRRLLPQVDIVGTDISDTAASVPNCIVWDMHEVKPEWTAAIDFIYSNSWDHTYDPRLMFSRWSGCLSPSGRMYLSYTDLHSERGATEDTKFDAFGCALDELLGILRSTLVLEDVLEIEPRFTRKGWKRTLAAVRTGRLRGALRGRAKSRRILVLVLKKRMSGDLHDSD